MFKRFLVGAVAAIASVSAFVTPVGSYPPPYHRPYHHHGWYPRPHGVYPAGYPGRHRWGDPGWHPRRHYDGYPGRWYR